MPAPRAATVVFLVALCLRPAITAVGPVLPLIGAEEGLGEGALGLLGALPLLAFAAVSPFVSRLAARAGMERAILVSLLVLAAATAARSLGGVALWGGTVLLGAAIAVGNVLVPAIVRRDHAERVSSATGLYSAFLTTSAAVASAVAVPLAALGGWRLSLGAWALLALLVALAWLPATRSAAVVAPSPPAEHGPTVWRRPEAWLLTAFTGLQSLTFYALVTWLPSVETADGIAAGEAGLHLFAYQLVGILGGLGIPLLLRRADRRLAGALLASAPVPIATVGLLLAPGLALLWVVIAGLGSGAALVVALSLSGLLARDHHEAARLSGMAQALGYLLAAGGPVGVGLLAEATGGWRVPLVLIATLGVAQLVVAVLVARPRPALRLYP